MAASSFDGRRAEAAEACGRIGGDLVDLTIAHLAVVTCAAADVFDSWQAASSEAIGMRDAFEAAPGGSNAAFHAKKPTLHRLAEKSRFREFRPRTFRPLWSLPLHFS